jgi:arylsulfatase A
LSFVERNREKPFLLYYPMMLTHGPFEPTPDSDDYATGREERAGTKKEPRENKKFVEMVAYADKLIGRLVRKLDELRLRKNTLVIVVGDNGTAAGIRSRVGDEIVDGGKGLLTKAGMHVPLIASWPGRVQSSQVNGNLIDTTDFLPTMCDAAGIAVPEELMIDGQSFYGQLVGRASQPRNWYYSWYAPRREFVGEFAATERLKLYRDGRIFDVERDPLEQSPLRLDELSAPDATKVASLVAVLAKFEDARPAELRAKPTALNARPNAPKARPNGPAPKAKGKKGKRNLPVDDE